MCGACYSRRSFLALGAAAALAGCSENADTGRRQLAFVSDDQLAGMADQAWSQVTAQVPPLRDPAYQARLARIAAPIVAASGRDLDWDFVVLDSPEFNAFVLPNGKVGFFRGLFDFARSDDEIGSVVGHEVGHIVARHPAERISQELAVRAGVGIAQILLANGEGGGQYAGEIAAALGLGAMYGVILPYSRKHELEADRVGVGLMREAGQDPRAAVSFWERMVARAAGQPRPIEALSTHPADDRRLAELRRVVEAA
ncbi:M48 family metallopeptidase [Phenylobacterium sp. J367]|uniref:M48 family metallopeptidase n=1 Tax=Phenylobacterium sp. J367 TaxID=2898435 RepID=UPI0021508C1B|nr:M48 family metallopeptidase [Phenylobacterium sp. J367]MCR5878109.1 M48 family metallopeptidase [Phenylobacterium sp. J367]